LLGHGHCWSHPWPKHTKFDDPSSGGSKQYNPGTQHAGDGPIDQLGFVLSSLFVPYSKPVPELTTGDGRLPGSTSLSELSVSRELDPTPKDLSSDPMNIGASLQLSTNF
jgi:hypothetical protein